MLYLIATPIGNLEDISYRAVRLLGEVDLILCEDKRRSQALLGHYSISTPLLDYHQFSEAKREEQIVERLRSGQQIALISDAGTPLISDPGHRLVVRCRQEGIELHPIPGPCALIAALTASSLPTDRFEFIGFFPRKRGELRRLLADTLERSATLIGYESPARLQETLDTLKELVPQRQIAVARELTKLYEEVKEGSAEEVAAAFTKEPPRGEIVVMIAPGKPTWEQVEPGAHVDELAERFELKRGEAIKLVAQLRGLPKSDLYRKVHEEP